MPINETLTDEVPRRTHNKRIERVDQFAIKIASIRVTSLFYVDIDVKLHNYDNAKWINDMNDIIKIKIYNGDFMKLKYELEKVKRSTLYKRINYVSQSSGNTIRVFNSRTSVRSLI